MHFRVGVNLLEGKVDSTPDLVSRVLNVLKRSTDDAPPFGFLVEFSDLSRATSTTQPNTGLFAALALTLTNSAMWLIFVRWPAC